MSMTSSKFSLAYDEVKGGLIWKIGYLIEIMNWLMLMKTRVN